MEEYIEHHGVKGMRWGVRKQKTSGIGRKKLNSKQSNAETDAAKKTRRKQIAKKVALFLAAGAASGLMRESITDVKASIGDLDIRIDKTKDLLNYRSTPLDSTNANWNQHRVDAVRDTSLATGALAGAAVATKVSSKKRKTK